MPKYKGKCFEKYSYHYVEGLTWTHSRSVLMGGFRSPVSQSLAINSWLMIESSLANRVWRSYFLKFGHKCRRPHNEKCCQAETLVCWGFSLLHVALLKETQWAHKVYGCAFLFHCSCSLCKLVCLRYSQPGPLGSFLLLNPLLNPFLTSFRPMGVSKQRRLFFINI